MLKGKIKQIPLIYVLPKETIIIKKRKSNDSLVVSLYAFYHSEYHLHLYIHNISANGFSDLLHCFLLNLKLLEPRQTSVHRPSG